MPDLTLTYKNNIQTRKMLIGIANFIKVNSEAAYLSSGSEVLTTAKEIRQTKKAQVLLPLLMGIKKVSEVLAQAKAGGVELTEIELNEFIVNLANEMITEPVIIRPRDEEVITGAESADGIVGRYQSGYQVVSVVAKDRNFYETILKNGKDGVEVARGVTGGKLKSAIVDAALKGATDKEKDEEFARLLLSVRSNIKKTKDKFIQGKIKNSDIVFIINTDGETRLENNATYNMYTEAAQKTHGVNVVITNADGSESNQVASPDAIFSGSAVLVSKQLPEHVDFIVFWKGAATSLFAIRQYINFDKLPGIQAYAGSMEFDEGTGVWLPHMIAFGTNDKATLVPQDAVGFDALIQELEQAITNSGNKNNEAGIGNDAGKVISIEELNAMTVKQLEDLAKENDIDLTGAADKAAKLAKVKASLGL